MYISPTNSPQLCSPYYQLNLPNHRRILSTNKNDSTQMQFEKLKFKQYGRAYSQKKLTLTQNHIKKVQQQQLYKQKQTLQPYKVELNINKQDLLKKHPSQIIDGYSVKKDAKILNKIIKQQNNPEVYQPRKYYTMQQISSKINLHIQNFNKQITNHKNIINKLAIKLQINQQKLIQSQNQLKQYIRLIGHEHIETRFNDIQTKMRLLFESSLSNQNQINYKISQLEQKTIRFIGSKLQVIKYKVGQFISSKQESLNKTQERLDDLSLEKIKKIQKLQNQISQIKQKLESAQQIPTKDSISEWSKLSQFSFNKEYLDIQGSHSQDFFFYPSFIQSNIKIKNVLEVLTTRNYPLNCYIDTAGYIRYSDSGTYLFDKKGNFINLSIEQIKYLESRKLIILSKNIK